MSLSSSDKLLIIKLVHTLIWWFFVTVIAYVVYAGATNTINALAWICIGLILAEGFVLWLNGGRCPLTPLAARYAASDKANFDIFLPEWLARNNKLIFTTIFVLGFVLVIIRVLS